MQFAAKTILSITLAATLANAVVVSRQTAGNYTTVFSDQFAAVEDRDFLTFKLLDTVDECLAVCDATDHCVFANTYLDVNGKGGSTQLTCALFAGCHTQDQLTNFGGQTQPDGTVDFIENSAGFCKVN